MWLFISGGGFSTAVSCSFIPPTQPPRCDIYAFESNCAAGISANNGTHLQWRWICKFAKWVRDQISSGKITAEIFFSPSRDFQSIWFLHDLLDDRHHSRLAHKSIQSLIIHSQRYKDKRLKKGSNLINAVWLLYFLGIGRTQAEVTWTVLNTCSKMTMPQTLSE